VTPLGVRHDEMLVRRHEGDGVHKDAELSGAESERVQVEPADGGIGAEEVMAAKGPSSNHHGVAGEHEPGLSHGTGRDAQSAPEVSNVISTRCPW